MHQKRDAYELSESQVTTPNRVVALFWNLTKQHRERLGSVFDMGAGDCRFARGGNFDAYFGVELDERRCREAIPPPNGDVACRCMFEDESGGYDACIGNPPYVRHHDIEDPWKEHTVRAMEAKLDVRLSRNCNLYVHALTLGLIKTNDRGLVALLVPFEWVSRPSAGPIREYIRAKGWAVTVYRFRSPIFDGVLTTASVSVIDKAQRSGEWKFFDIEADFSVVPRSGVTGSNVGLLGHERRGEAWWAMRGLSPGSQRIFTLTEGERIHFGLAVCDVVPCVTTLRRVPLDLRMLTRSSFRTHFVRAGEKCWLIRANEGRLSPTLKAYLDSVAERDRQTATCQARAQWFAYRPHPVPRLLLASGFTESCPKVLINSVGAQAVGSVYGVHGSGGAAVRRLQEHLLGIDFEGRVVAHAKTLKKVEVHQVNAVLNAFVQQERADAGNRP